MTNGMEVKSVNWNRGPRDRIMKSFSDILTEYSWLAASWILRNKTGNC